MYRAACGARISPPRMRRGGRKADGVVGGAGKIDHPSASLLPSLKTGGENVFGRHVMSRSPAVLRERQQHMEKLTVLK
jgi:hypothetical protein